MSKAQAQRPQCRSNSIGVEVEWTDIAAEMIAKKQYRYISPTFKTKRASLDVHSILRAAQANNSALEPTQLASRQNDTDTRLEQAGFEAMIASLMGLKADATQVEIAEALQALMDGSGAIDGKNTC